MKVNIHIVIALCMFTFFNYMALYSVDIERNGVQFMKIEHIAMYVADLEGARDFFVKYLDGKSNDGYHNPKTDFRSYFISFDDGYDIVSGPRTTGDGYYESCIVGIEGNQIEITI